MEEWVENKHAKGTLTILAMENAEILPNKFAIDTASGVLCTIKCTGMTGYEAEYFSTSTNSIVETRPEARRPQIRGSDHGISSDVFKLNAKRGVPTAVTSVKDPSKSMRRSLSAKDRLWTSSGRTIFTLTATRIMLSTKMGALFM